MILEIGIAIIIGIILGTITGLTPGIHINLIAAIVMAGSSRLLEYFPALYIGTTLISMAVTHTFLDIIPTTFLGAADSDNALTLLPSHRLLMEGRGLESIKLAIFGSFFGLVAIIILTPVIIGHITAAYEIIKDYIQYILIGISIIIIKKSKEPKIAILVFILSGVLGVVVFSLKTLEQPLFPLLSGLFGISALILGIKNKINIPEQIKDLKLNIDNLKIFTNIIVSCIASLFTSFLPGLTSSHTTAVASAINEIKDEKDYIIVNSAINTISMFLSLIALYSIDKARSGVIVTLSNIMSVGKLQILYFTAVCLITAFIAIFLTLKLERIFSKFMPRLNYKRLCSCIIGFLLILTILISGGIGIIVLVISTCVGIFCLLTNIERIHLMGTLILPVILYFSL